MTVYAIKNNKVKGLKDMSILRNKNREQYVVVTMQTIRDNRLKNKDIGALVRLLALPDNWKFSVSGLITGGENRVMPDGKDSVSSSINRLEELGYLVRKQKHGSKGNFLGVEWEIFETSKKIGKPLTEKPLTEKPLTGNPLTGKPSTEKTTQSNNNISNNNQSIIKSVNTLSQEDYAYIVAHYPRELVDYTILKITERNYQGCMNRETIIKWCEEYLQRRPIRINNNQFNHFTQNEYDFDTLEKEILSN